jgi:hypothetical protein
MATEDCSASDVRGQTNTNFASRIMAEFAQGSSVVIPIADVGDEAECIGVEGRRIGEFFIQLPSKAVVGPPQPVSLLPAIMSAARAVESFAVNRKELHVLLIVRSLGLAIAASTEAAKAVRKVDSMRNSVGESPSTTLK